MRLQISNHLLEVCTAGGLRSFNIHVFLDNDKTVVRGVALQQLLLRGNGKAFLLLLLGGDACISKRLGRFGTYRLALVLFHYVVAQPE